MWQKSSNATQRATQNGRLRAGTAYRRPVGNRKQRVLAGIRPARFSTSQWKSGSRRRLRGACDLGLLGIHSVSLGVELGGHGGELILDRLLGSRITSRDGSRELVRQ